MKCVTALEGRHLFEHCCLWSAGRVRCVRLSRVKPVVSPEEVCVPLEIGSDLSVISMLNNSAHGRSFNNVFSWPSAVPFANIKHPRLSERNTPGGASREQGGSCGYEACARASSSDFRSAVPSSVSIFARSLRMVSKLRTEAEWQVEAGVGSCRIQEK